MKPYCSQSSQSVISALILSIGLFFLAISAKADQWGDWTYTVSGSNVTITGYAGTNGDISIPVTISNQSVVAIGDAAFLTSQVSTVTIGEGVLNIGDYVFNSCSNLVDVSISSSVTNIGESPFSNCPHLASIAVVESNASYASSNGVLFDVSRSLLIKCPEGMTGSYILPESVVCIGAFAFGSCAGLTNIVIGERTTSIGDWAFSRCLGLTGIIMPASITNVGLGAFANTGLNGFGFPPSIDCIHAYTFMQCSNLTSITIPDYVATVGEYAFAYCVALTNVVLPNSLEVISAGLLRECVKLERIEIPPNVTDIGGQSFSGCSAMKKITIPQTVTNISEGAFVFCSNLSGIYFDGNSPYIGEELVFYGDDILTVYYYPWTSGWGTTFGGRPTVPVGLSYIVNNGAVEITGYSNFPSVCDLTIPNAISNLPVTSVGYLAFNRCSSLTSVSMPESVTNIDVGAFCYCTNLTSVSLSSRISKISVRCFYQCPSLVGILIPSSVNIIGVNAFSGCSSLTNVTLPAGLAVIQAGAFDSCSSLTDVVIPSSVTNIGLPFLNKCGSLTSITVDEANQYFSSRDGVLFKKDQTRIIKYPDGRSGDYAIPSGVTNVVAYAFSYCNRLASIEIPESVISFHSFSFRHCTNLTSITIPSGVTWLSTSVFSDCENLTSMYFKVSAPAIGTNCFMNDFNLTVYYYPWTSGWADTYGGRPTAINPAYTQWLNNYGFTTNLTDDADKDGMLNWQEFLAHTDPTTNIDCLAVSFMDFGTNTAQISWQAKSNVTYQVMKSQDLMVAWSNAPSGIGGNQQSCQTAPMDGVLQYADPDVTGMTNAFYRVNVVP